MSEETRKEVTKISKEASQHGDALRQLSERAKKLDGDLSKKLGEASEKAAEGVEIVKRKLDPQKS